MKTGRPSPSAFGVALQRAAHQVLDRPTVFHDPLALRVIGGEIPASTDVRGRSYIAVRSRFAEDRLAEAVNRGVRQYVLLGAGLDTFAWRNPHAGLRVFEVDHPATQAWKRRRFAAVGLPAPPALSFVPVDLDRQTLAAGLAQAGFRPDAPAFCALLGVAIYLPTTTVKGILRFVASLPRGSAIAFDYGMLASSLTEGERAERERGARQSAAAGEPYTTFFDPPALARDLHALGFASLEDLGVQEMNARFFAGRSDGLAVPSGGRRLICARLP